MRLCWYWFSVSEVTYISSCSFLPLEVLNLLEVPESRIFATVWCCVCLSISVSLSVDVFVREPEKKRVYDYKQNINKHFNCMSYLQSHSPIKQVMLYTFGYFFTNTNNTERSRIVWGLHKMAEWINRIHKTVVEEKENNSLSLSDRFSLVCIFLKL